MKHNGYVYETFGISKHFPIKLQLILIRAEALDNPLTAKCFIYDVELNPPSRIALLKVPDSFYTSKLFTNKISSNEKEIGFYHCRAGYCACS